MRGVYALGLQPTTAGPTDGYVPPGALSWNDADDNNAFHAKQIIVDLDYTISTELALYHKKEDYDDILTLGLPLDNTADSVATWGRRRFHPKRREERRGRQGLPEIRDPADGSESIPRLGRTLPAMPDLVKDDPFWLDPKDPHRSAGRARADDTQLCGLQSRIR
jgi:multiple sugar transport system substrate-binding protein